MARRSSARSSEHWLPNWATVSELPSNAKHPDGTTGDVQQHTSTGLLYWRKSTNIPTFINGAEHWALRDTQALHWATDKVDPPEDAQVGPVPGGSAPLGAPQPTTVTVPTLTASAQAAG